jgi:hypothetical protein
VRVRAQAVRHHGVALIHKPPAMPQHIRPAGTLLLQAALVTLCRKILRVEWRRQKAPYESDCQDQTGHVRTPFYISTAAVVPAYSVPLAASKPPANCAVVVESLRRSHGDVRRVRICFDRVPRVMHRAGGISSTKSKDTARPSWGSADVSSHSSGRDVNRNAS